MIRPSFQIQFAAVCIGGIVAVGSAMRLLRNARLKAMISNRQYMSVQELVNLADKGKKLESSDKVVVNKKNNFIYAIVIGKLVTNDFLPSNLIL